MRFMNSRSCEVISSAPGERLEEAFEPDDRLDVEVVGRLVHQQHVGAAEQHPGHRHPHLPAARQRADVAVDALVVEAEAVQDLARLRLEGVAAEMVVGLLHFAEAGQDPVQIAGLGRVRQVVLQLLELVVQVADAAAAGNRLVEHRPARHLLDVLAEVADRQPLRHRHVALVGGLLADDHPEQRGLAGAVGADEPDLFTGVELEAGVDEEDLAAVLLADARERDHDVYRMYVWYPSVRTLSASQDTADGHHRVAIARRRLQVLDEVLDTGTPVEIERRWPPPAYRARRIRGSARSPGPPAGVSEGRLIAAQRQSRRHAGHQGSRAAAAIH